MNQSNASNLKKKKSAKHQPTPPPSSFQPFTFSFLSQVYVRLHVAGFPAFLLTVTWDPMNNSASPFTSTNKHRRNSCHGDPPASLVPLTSSRQRHPHNHIIQIQLEHTTCIHLKCALNVHWMYMKCTCNAHSMYIDLTSTYAMSPSVSNTYSYMFMCCCCLCLCDWVRTPAFLRRFKL